MKKSIKKLSLNKKSVSDLSTELKGGLGSITIEDKTSDTYTTGPTGPTAMTMCYICPVRER